MKIEFDLPEFDKEIKVEIIIRKDGEVVYSTSSSSSSNRPSTVIREEKPRESTEVSNTDSKFSGNLMGMEF